MSRTDFAKLRRELASEKSDIHLMISPHATRPADLAGLLSFRSVSF